MSGWLPPRDLNDNGHAHRPPGARYRQPSIEHDHWHRTGDDPGRPYAFTTADQLLADFFAEDFLAAFLTAFLAFFGAAFFAAFLPFFLAFFTAGVAAIIGGSVATGAVGTGSCSIMSSSISSPKVCRSDYDSRFLRCVKRMTRRAHFVRTVA